MCTSVCVRARKQVHVCVCAGTRGVRTPDLYLESGGPQLVVLAVGQCLRGRNNDGITGVNAKGVEVFHVTNSDAIIIAITNNLILKLLPSS